MKSFNKTDFAVMALGNIIGSGIFLASGLVITIAGSWAPLAYLLGGLVMMMEVAFIIEMTIANPVPGSFKVYAQEVFGDWWGFVVGWMFWSSGVLGMASEVTACAIFSRLWFPHTPLWVLSLVFSCGITLANFNDLKGLSKLELGLSVTKVLTLVLFLLLGILLAAGIPIGNTTENLAPFRSLTEAPLQGFTGVLGSMLLIFFAYTGTGIIGLAAVETENPEKSVPPAALAVTSSIVLLYTLATFFIITLLPVARIDPATSPFVQIFHAIQLPYAGDIINFILLSAALSALNSQVYSSSRMLFSLAQDRQAPELVGYRNKKGVPTVAVAFSGTVLLLIVLLSYHLPEKIFIYTVSASGFLALINWLSISATHYFYHKKLLKTAPEKLKYKAPGYPYLSWICFGAIILTILTTPLYPDQLPGLYSGSILLVIIGAAYYVRQKVSN
ncbi:MAG: amino acid permease [Negativicutes bacterium]|nr:amino acid permease [Negativicutes bacterium]